MNQIESSRLTTTSLGELRRLPCHLSARTEIEPSNSVLVTRRVRCSQVTSRPSLSTVLPFELFDGFQIVATGALRGLGDTRQPMLAHLLGYWVVGVPIAYVLCFPLHWGATGIWVGLTAALILIGAALVTVWWRRIASL